MKQNLGTLDRVLRFALAFWWLGPWAPLSPIFGEWGSWLMLIVGWIALIESFFGWCWIHDLLKIKSK
ncbi:DUF2892 domain-containing protein [Candidatus Woesearchaeota archaeon]|nr:DUF2892 domain-containing protein [Candidatus Woesearchaeota archaeon]